MRLCRPLPSLGKVAPTLAGRVRVVLLLYCIPYAIGFAMVGHWPLPQAAAQRIKGSPKSMALDVVMLSSGTRFYGVVIQNDDQAVKCVVEREWFRNQHPKLYQEQLQIEKRNYETIKAELVRRVDDWIEDRKTDKDLVLFLEDERRRIAQDENAEDLENKRFLVVEIPAAELNKVVVQTPAQRRIAAVAWKHNMKNVSVQKADVLLRQLKRKKIDVENETVDFSAEIPAMRQSDRQWNARVAIIEFEYRQPLEYQGNSKMMLRKGDKQNIGLLIGEMLGNQRLDMTKQIAKELGLRDFDEPAESKDDNKKWWKKATEEAEKEGFRGVLVSRLDQNIQSPEVKVETRFLAMVQPGQWEIIGTFSDKANVNDQDPDEAKGLLQDPRIKSVVEMIELTGLGDKSLLDKALRHGAATGKAMNAAGQQFFNFKKQYIERVDSPPLLFK